MLVLILVFAAIPAAYFLTYDGSLPQYAMYATTLASLLFGFGVSRVACSRFPVSLSRTRATFQEKRAVRMAAMLLLGMAVTAAVAILAIRELGTDYRMLFFQQQHLIFGYEHFGFFFQILTEYSALAFFSIVLTRNSNIKWKLCLVVWMLLGTIVTLGRWYVVSASVIALLTRPASRQRHFLGRTLLVGIGGAVALAGSAALFVCRADACSFELELLQHGLVKGVLTYLYIPIEMIPIYEDTPEFSLNLFTGFSVYPLEFLGRLLGIFKIDYEYARWAVLIQDYVKLDNLGYCNALVGQPLTSYVAAGYSRIVAHYASVGAMCGIRYHDSRQRHPVAMLSTVVTAVSFFIPSISGPMFATSMISFIALRHVLIRPSTGVGTSSINGDTR